MNVSKGARDGSFMLKLELTENPEKLMIFDIPTDVANRTDG